MPTRADEGAHTVSPSGVAAIVLAAGASRRMGPDVNKLLLPLGGEPMVRRVVRRAVEAGLTPVVIVVGHDAARVRAALDGLPCAFAENAEYVGPASSSLHAGVRVLHETPVAAAVVLLGDMPHVSVAMLQALAMSLSGGAGAAISRYAPAGVIGPPLGFRRELWPQLLAVHGEGAGRAVALANPDAAAWHDWPAQALDDVDTPAEYEALAGGADAAPCDASPDARR